MCFIRGTIAESQATTQEEGRTALMQAASGGHVAVVQALLEAGADIDLKTPVSFRR